MSLTIKIPDNGIGFSFHSIKIPPISHYVYIQWSFSLFPSEFENFTLFFCLSLCSSKITRNLGVMKLLSNDISLDSLVTLYLTLTEPYFRYCNTVWGNCKQGLLNNLQTLQKRAARIVTRGPATQMPITKQY